MNKKMCFTYKIFRIATFSLFAILFSSGLVNAQQKLNVDSLFLVARQYAMEGNYDQAVEMSNAILSSTPDYYDVAILKSRIYGWQKDYSTAEKLAKDVIAKDPKNYDAYLALSTFYFWDNKHEECIETTNRALSLYEEDLELLILRARAELALGSMEEAVATVGILLELDPQNEAVIKLQDQIELNADPALLAEMDKLQSQIEPKSQSKLNADSLLTVAGNYAAKKDYEQAREITDQILDQYPNYADAQILEARTYAWEKQYDMALNELNTVLENYPENYSALSARSDVLFWQSDYNGALSSLNEAIIAHPNDTELLTKKLKVQVALYDQEGAQSTLNRLNELDPQNTNYTKEYKNDLSSRPYKDIIRAEYNYETFNEPWKRMWTMFGAAYGRRTDKWGDYYANIYLGDVILPDESLWSNEVGVQLELELYPKIDDYNTFYVAYAWSPSVAFASHRVGLEYYHTFPDVLDASIGYRFMNFSNSDEDPVNVNIITASVAKYIGSYWLSFRPYAVFTDGDVNSTYELTGRKYLSRPESFVGLTLSGGVSSPDDNFFQSNGGDVPLYETFKIQAQFKYRISPTLLGDIITGFENAEYTEGERRNQFNLRIALSYLL